VLRKRYKWRSQQKWLGLRAGIAENVGPESAFLHPKSRRSIITTVTSLVATSLAAAAMPPKTRKAPRRPAARPAPADVKKQPLVSALQKLDAAVYAYKHEPLAPRPWDEGRSKRVGYDDMEDEWSDDAADRWAESLIPDYCHDVIKAARAAGVLLPAGVEDACGAAEDADEEQWGEDADHKDVMRAAEQLTKWVVA
jgi:hypothetical protein